MKNIYILIAFLLFAALNFYFYFFNSYDKLKYTVTMNEKELAYYLDEKYTHASFPIFVHVKNYNKKFQLNSKNENLNEMILNDPILDFKVYECYNVHNKKRIACTKNYQKEDKPIEKEVDIIPYQMVIQSKDKVLYKGKYISDLSEYVKEEGRYYFTLYLKIKNKLFETTKTKILFQIKFIGDDYE